MADNLYHGTCLCGVIQFSVSSFSPLAAHCHCTMCRKFHGAAFGTLVEVDGLHWNSGEQLLKTYQGHNGTQRFFCDVCGSSIGFLSAEASASIEIAIALFDEPIPVKPDANIFTLYKANWDETRCQLPSFNEGREP